MAELPTGTTPTNPPPMPGGDLKGNPTLATPRPRPETPIEVLKHWDDKQRAIDICFEIQLQQGSAAAAEFWGSYQAMRR